MSRFGEYPDSGPPPQDRSWSLDGAAGPGGSAASSRRGPPSLGAGLSRGPVVEPLDEPFVVVAVDERGDHSACLLERLEAVEVEALLLQRPHKALDDAVALGLPNVRRRDRDPQPLHFVDPGIGNVLRAPVATDRQSSGDVLPEGAEGVAHPLADGLQRRPAIAELRHMPAQKLVDPVVDRPEEPAPPLLLGVEARRVRAPHHIGSVGDDRARVCGVAVRRAEPPGRQQFMLAHQPQDPLATDGQTPMREPRPDLPVTLAVERTRTEDGADPRHELGVGPAGLRAPLRRRARRRRRPLGRVHARAGHPEHLTDERHGIASARPRADMRPHPLRLFHSSVRPLFSIRYSASSSRIVNSPTLARARVSSRSSGSLRLFSPRPPASRKTRFQPSRSCAGTWLSRETASSGSPRRRRRTSSISRWALHRSGNSSGALGAGVSSPPGLALVGFFAIPTSMVHRHPTIWEGTVQGNRVRSSPGLELTADALEAFDVASVPARPSGSVPPE